MIFMFHNDEVDLIADWLQYYSFMFGFSNIHVIDHMSQEPTICKLLSMYLHCGVNVTSYVGPFNGKSKRLSDEMKSAVKTEPRFLIPVDADEFLTPSEIHEQQYDNLNILQLRHNLLRTFNELPLDGRKYKFTMKHVMYAKDQCLRFSSDPKEMIRRVLTDGYISSDPDLSDKWAKTFYYSQGFEWTDQGNHRGRVKNDQQFGNADEKSEVLPQHYIFSNISLYHYYLASYTGYIHKIVRAVKSYGFNSSTSCKGIGAQYCKKKFDHFDTGKLVCSRETYIKITGCGGIMPRAYRNDRFKTIFTIYAKTLTQLVGE